MRQPTPNSARCPPLYEKRHHSLILRQQFDLVSFQRDGAFGFVVGKIQCISDFEALNKSLHRSVFISRNIGFQDEPGLARDPLSSHVGLEVHGPSGWLRSIPHIHHIGYGASPRRIDHGEHSSQRHLVRLGQWGRCNRRKGVSRRPLHRIGQRTEAGNVIEC